MTPRADDATAYQLRVAGHLDQRWSTWFEGFTITHEDDGTTSLRGEVIDQSELHGLLAKVRDLGVPLIALQRTTEAANATGSAAETGTTARDTDSQERQHR